MIPNSHKILFIIFLFLFYFFWIKFSILLHIKNSWGRVYYIFYRSYENKLIIINKKSNPILNKQDKSKKKK